MATATNRIMTIQTQDLSGDNHETKEPFYISSTATYEQINIAARGLVALSMNTYVDTLITQTVSVNEELSD